MAFLCFFVKSFPFFFNLAISVLNLKKLRYSVKRCSSCSKRHRTFWPEAHFGGNLFFQPLLHEFFCRKVKSIEKNMVLDLQLAVGWKLVRVNEKYKIFISTCIVNTIDVKPRFFWIAAVFAARCMSSQSVSLFKNTAMYYLFQLFPRALRVKVHWKSNIGISEHCLSSF